MKLKKLTRDVPHGPVVKNLLCNAGDTVSIPGQRTKIPHALEQPSPHTATPKSVPQLESLCTTTKDSTKAMKT